MRLQYSKNFKIGVEKLPEETKIILKSKLSLMRKNPRHPSLRTKKIQGENGIFEASITKNIRMTWHYTKNGIFLRRIGKHDKTLDNP